MHDWTLIASISSMVAFWVTALFMLYQIRHMQTASNLEVTMRMFEWSESNRMRDALRWVSAKFDCDAFLKQSEEERSDYPGMVIAFFEQAGIMIERRLVDEEVVIDHLALSVILSWRHLEPLVRRMREQSDDERFGEHFEFLFHRAEAYETAFRRRGNKHMRSKR
jgi:hypothetical protein